MTSRSQGRKKVKAAMLGILADTPSVAAAELRAMQAQPITECGGAALVAKLRSKLRQDGVDERRLPGYRPRRYRPAPAEEQTAQRAEEQTAQRAETKTAQRAEKGTSS